MNKQLYGMDITDITERGSAKELDLYVLSESTQSAIETAKNFFGARMIIGQNMSDQKYTTDDVFTINVDKTLAEQFYSTDTEDMYITNSVYISEGVWFSLQMMKNDSARLVILTADYDGFEIVGAEGTGMITQPIFSTFTTRFKTVTVSGKEIDALIAIAIE